MGYIVTHASFVFATDGKCPFSSGKLVVDALQKIHPTPAMKVGSVLPQTTGVRQMVTMPLSAQGKVLEWKFMIHDRSMPKWPLSTVTSYYETYL